MKSEILGPSTIRILAVQPNGKGAPQRNRNQRFSSTFSPWCGMEQNCDEWTKSSIVVTETMMGLFVVQSRSGKDISQVTPGRIQNSEDLNDATLRNSPFDAG